MISLIHLLEHLGLPSGIAIAVVIGARKLLKAGLGQLGPRRGGDRDHLDRDPRDRSYRDGYERGRRDAGRYDRDHGDDRPGSGLGQHRARGYR